MPGPIDEHREDVRTGSSEAADKIVDLKLGASALAAIPPLPKIYGEDKRISRAEEYFRFSQRYQYVRLLGHGAYGLVCAAIDQQTGQSVAIKRINQINSLLVARRTLRELKLLRHLQGHPNIICIRDLFLQPPSTKSIVLGSGSSSNFDELYITQDLMDADLCHIIQSKHPLSEIHCQRFLYQLLCGVKAMHTANVIHRDLKPGNILWKHNGELRICDFGLARGLGEDSSSDAAEMNLTNYVATRWYRPPEILMYRASYGKPLDIWSVGCIFAELLGRKVFLPGQSGTEQLHLILQKLGTPPDNVIDRIPSVKCQNYIRRLPRYPPYPLAKRFPTSSPEALDLLEKMLAFDPNERISVEDALAHPYLSRFRDAAKETSVPPFDFSFDKQCVTLAEIKTCILEEISLYRASRVETPLSCKLDLLQVEDQPSRDHHAARGHHASRDHIAAREPTAARTHTASQQPSQPGRIIPTLPRFGGNLILPLLPHLDNAFRVPRQESHDDSRKSA